MLYCDTEGTIRLPRMSPLSAQRENRDFAYELKFYVGSGEASALKDWVRSQLDPDPHGGGPHGDSYRVSSVYFDTSGFDVLARQGSFGRSKYRIRRYDHSDTVYLERKTRVYKRRSATELQSLPRLLVAQPSREWDGRWFHRRLLVRALEAVSRIDYQRIARIGYSDFGPVRLTLDQELRAWRTRALSFNAGGTATMLSSQQLILELKFGHTMPAVFKQLIREFAPQFTGISKYRLACAALGLSAHALAPTELPPEARSIIPVKPPAAGMGAGTAALRVISEKFNA